MNTIPISTKELRLNMPKVRRGLSNGRKYLLIHRSKPVAEILPLQRWPATPKNAFDIFINPPKELMFKSSKTAVELIRAEREE